MMGNRNYTIAYRITHWAIAICMLLLLGTIFLRSTWLNKNHVAGIIQNYLSATTQTLSQDQLITLAKQIREPMWDWHIYLGYVLVGLFGLRFALAFSGQMEFSSPFNKQLSSKEKLQFWVYLVFYFCVVISLLTGLMIEFGPKYFKESMEEIHILSIYYLALFIILHFGGVLLAEFTNRQGLVSKIISGTRAAKNS